MANFDYRKALKENKATFFSSLTEGQFSWMTHDTEKQIGSEPQNTITVYMHDDEGNTWKEDNYEGYGEFGGMDYYELLDKMNGGEGDRSEGIRLAFDNAAVAAGKVLFPALTEDPTYPKGHDFTQEAKHDPDQSWYAGEEDDDDEYSSWRDEEEDEDELYEAQFASDSDSQFDSDIEDNTNKNDFAFWYRAGVRGKAQALKAQELLKQNGIDADYSKGPFYIDFSNAGVEQRVVHQMLRDAGLANFVVSNVSEGQLNEAQGDKFDVETTKKIAQKVADAFTADDDLDLKYVVSPDVEESSFNLDVEAGPNTPGEDWKDVNGFSIDNYLGKYAGGSFYIKDGVVINAAARGAKVANVSPEGEVEMISAEDSRADLDAREKANVFVREENKSNKMKKSELKEMIKAALMNEVTLDIDNMEDTHGEEDFLAEVEAILAEADEIEEGVWSVVPARIPEFIKAVDALKDEYHGVVGSDDVFNGLDAAISAAEELLMNTAEINEADEEVVDDTEVAVGDEENIDVDMAAKVDPNVKAVQDALTQAQAAAQKLGDAKLTDQIGNTITFFTRQHVAGTEKSTMEENIDEIELSGDFAMLADTLGVSIEAAKYLTVATGLAVPVILAAIQAGGSAIANFFKKTAAKKSMAEGKELKETQNSEVLAMVELIMDALGPERFIDELISAMDTSEAMANLKHIIQMWDLDGSEMDMEEGKKEYYKDAEADDAEHIKALEKDMKDDKKSSEKLQEAMFPILKKILK